MIKLNRLVVLIGVILTLITPAVAVPITPPSIYDIAFADINGTTPVGYQNYWYLDTINETITHHIYYDSWLIKDDVRITVPYIWTGRYYWGLTEGVTVTTYTHHNIPLVWNVKHMFVDTQTAYYNKPLPTHKAYYMDMELYHNGYTGFYYSIHYDAIPEPSSLLALLVGCVGLRKFYS